jgi:hypothetical protein
MTEQFGLRARRLFLRASPDIISAAHSARNNDIALLATAKIWRECGEAKVSERSAANFYRHVACNL